MGVWVAASAADDTTVVVGGIVDYYELLAITPDATKAEIKAAYYGLQKECHPDYTGDEGHNMCVLLNSAYDTLTDPEERAYYDRQLAKAMLDDEDGYTGQPVSKWMGLPEENRAVFVDEVSCIGCKNCVFEAPATFRIEPEHGRSRVFAQWMNNEESLQTAIDSCPVDCIHWVDRAQLPVLEHVMKGLDRVNVGMMMSGGDAGADVFQAAATFAKRRAEKMKDSAKERQESAVQREARERAAADIRKRQNASGGWGKFWGRSGVGGRRRSGRESTIPTDRSLVPAATEDRARKFRKQHGKTP